MKLLLQLIFYGLFATSVLSILDRNNKVKRHIWRGQLISQTIDPSRSHETKGSRSNPPSLHHTLTPHCTLHENGLKAHPTNCQMYINCWDGKASIDTCSEGFFFNEATKECDFASNVACPATSGHRAPLYANHDPSFHDTSQYTDIDREVINDFKCSHEGIFEHPNDCTKFIQCAHSGLYIQSCGPGTMFNPSLLVCDWPSNVRCNKNVNANIQSQTPNRESKFAHNHEGQKTRPVDAVYDYDFDVRMSDTNSRSNNNNKEQQHRGFSTSSAQNAQTQLNQRRYNDSLQMHSLNSQGTNGYSRTEQREFQLQTKTRPQYPSQTGSQYPSQTDSQYPSQTGSQYPSQTDSHYHSQTSSQYPSQTGSRYPSQTSFQNPSQTGSRYPSQTSSQYPSQTGSQYPLQTDSQYSSQTSSQHPSQTSFQNISQTGSQHPSQTSAQNTPRPNFPYPTQTNSQYDSHISSQHVPQTSSQHVPQTNFQHVPQIDSQFSSQVPVTQQRSVHPAISQSRSFQSEPNTQSIQGIITSVQPLHSNGVHSSPSYSKTKVYSAQQTHAHDSGIYSSQSASSAHQYNPCQQSGQGNYQREEISRQSFSNGHENVDQTMDLLDTYTNMDISRRDARKNVMTVNSNKDHEVPIYHRPQNLRFSSRISDDMQTSSTESVLALNDALKLMLSPYTKSSQLKNDDVNEMTTKLLSAVENKEDTEDESDVLEAGTGTNIRQEVLNQEPFKNFDETISENDKPYNNHRYIFVPTSTSTPTPTPDTEILPEFNAPTYTKSGRLPHRTNSLVSGNENKKYHRVIQPSYQREEIELFCTTGFDCGNGVCLSSEKVCDGQNNCGNGKDEQNCKHINYEVRLSGDGDRRNMGRIEVKVFEKWGHICDDGFGLNEANVLCREAGFPLGAVELKVNSYYPPYVNVTAIDASPKFGMEELRCTGNETSIKDCSFNGWGVHDCSSEEIVGVVCKLPDMKCQLNYWLCDQSEECIPTAFLCDAVSDCSDGSDESAFHCNSSIQYRLGNPKSNHREGRVEVRYKGIWGTVCDDDFGENEAKVFCRSLGYDGAAAVIKEFAQPGDGLIWLDQVSCIGNESSLEKCTHFEWGENNCNHTEDVSVRCFDREVETHQKLIIKDRKSGFAQLNEISRRGKSEQDQHCGQIRVFDDPDDYDDQPVFKVIDGREAKRGHHPWQATIRVRGRQGKSSHWCGAVLISKTHVLTAAHCLIGFTKNAYFIRFGDHHSEVPEDTEVEVFIEDWHIHEKFRKGHLMNNDIALIKLKEPVKFTDYIQPICLPTEETEYTAGKNCSISGWGSIQYGKSTPSLQLRSAHIPIMSEEICKQPNNYGNSIQNGMFCAGIPDNMIDACDGDSGGPFTCQENGENGYHALYGIISWGQRCGDRHKPGVYTKVSEYLSWIQEKLLL